ncbi:MAG: cytochrome P450 [Alphaproteobacteria bacterium]|nr:cytochrome P450 [Alphaproteobacteria bacterium]
MSQISYNPVDDENVECPYPLFAALRREAPVHYSPELGYYLVTRYEDCVAVMLNTDAFKGFGPAPIGLELAEVCPADPRRLHRPQQGLGLAMSKEGAAYRRSRRLFNAALSPEVLAALEPDIRRIVGDLIDQWIDAGTVEFIDRFASAVPARVIAVMLGYPEADWQTYRRWADSFIDAISGLVLPDGREQEVMAERAATLAFQQERVAEQWEDPESFVGRLRRIRHHDDVPSTREELASLSLSLLTGGLDTTTNLLGNAMYELASRPGHWQRLRRTPALIPNMIEEALRHEPPTTGLYRSCVADTEVGGTLIPRGAGLMVCFASGNRDEAQFPEPESFDMERDNARANISFGKGMRFCPGAPLARLEGRIAFEELTRRLADVRLSPSRNDFRHIPSLLFRRLQRLWLDVDAA